MAHIVVIGSVALDEVVKLDQPLREGTHLSGKRQGVRLGGGAACTAVPLAYRGHDVTVIGSIGRDDAGAGLVAELGAIGVDTSQITFLDQPTTRSLILVDGLGERTIINVSAPTRTIRRVVSWTFRRTASTCAAAALISPRCCARRRARRW
jgi:ribokinase